MGLVSISICGVCFNSAQQWRRLVTDGLATDDVDVTMTRQVIIVFQCYKLSKQEEEFL